MNITINRNESGTFFVLHGDEFADSLTFDEMLGLVASLAMPAQRRCLTWLRTADQWRDRAREQATRLAGLRDEPVDLGEFKPLPTATEAAALREQTIAIAVAQDGADERVRGDWLPPLKRSEVVLNAGDVVTLRGGTGPFVVSECDDGSTYPFFVGPFSVTRNGAFYHQGPHDHRADIVTINSRQIIED